MNKSPNFLKKYFWDTDFQNLDKEKYGKEIIFRILEMGDERAVKWMNKNFSKDQIIEVLKNRRGFSPRSILFWTEIFKISQDQVLCLQKPYLKTKNRLWPY